MQVCELEVGLSAEGAVTAMFNMAWQVGHGMANGPLQKFFISDTKVFIGVEYEVAPWAAGITDVQPQVPKSSYHGAT